MSVGKLTITRFNGVESFAIDTAEMTAWSAKWLESSIELAINFEIQTIRPPLQTLPDSEGLAAQPTAEITLVFREPAPVALAGRRFVVPSAFDDEYEDHVSRFYYVEHEDVYDNVVEVLDRQGSFFGVRWSGKTLDVNYYDGSKPPAEIRVEATFHFPEADQWITRTS